MWVCFLGEEQEKKKIQGKNYKVEEEKKICAEKFVNARKMNKFVRSVNILSKWLRLEEKSELRLFEERYVKNCGNS